MLTFSYDDRTREGKASASNDTEACGGKDDEADEAGGEDRQRESRVRGASDDVFEKITHVPVSCFGLPEGLKIRSTPPRWDRIFKASACRETASRHAVSVSSSGLRISHVRKRSHDFEAGKVSATLVFQQPPLNVVADLKIFETLVHLADELETHSPKGRVGRRM